MAKMDDDTLKAILANYQGRAKTYFSQTVIDRERNLDYYYAELFGNEDAEHSQVVLSDVQDTVETIMPDLMEIFAGGTNIVQFEPQQQEDEDAAEQTGDMCTYIWTRDNNGYLISHDWIKDALIQRLGIIKIYQDETERTRVYYQTGIDAIGVEKLMNDPEVEILEQEEVDQQIEPPQQPQGQPLQQHPMLGMQQPNPQAMSPMGPGNAGGAPPVLGGPMADGNGFNAPVKLYNLKLKRTKKGGRIQIDNVPPEEYLTIPLVRNEEDAPFQAHRVRKTISDLREMGYKTEDLDAVSDSGDMDDSFEKTNRYATETGWLGGSTEAPGDETLRTVMFWENYVKCDYDGDGIAELRRVCTVGDTILENEEIQSSPFVCITPIRMPHKLIGRAVVDLVKDIQLLRSTFARQMVDNVVRINNNRTVVNERVDLDDYLANRPGGAIRVSGSEPAGDSIFPIAPQPIAGAILPLLEFFSGEKESRVGVTRYNQGTDAGTLNKTATGIQSILGRAQKRVIFIARTIAETGYTRAFGKIRDLLIEHQQEPRTIRLRNKWVPVDPRSWNADMDVQVHLALGTGTREQLAGQIMQAFPVIQSILAMQGGMSGPLITDENVYNMMKLWLNGIGIKNEDAYLTDPQELKAEGWQPPPPPPDPNMVKAQADVQISQQKAGIDAQIQQQKAQLDAQKMQADMGMQNAQMQHEMELERQRLAFEMEMKRAEMGMKMQMSQQESAHKMQLGEQDAKTNRDLKKAEAQHKGIVPAEGEDIKGVADILAEASEKQTQALSQAVQALTGALETLSKPRATKLIRGKDGRATHAVSEVVN